MLIHIYIVTSLMVSLRRLLYVKLATNSTLYFYSLEATTFYVKKECLERLIILSYSTEQVPKILTRLEYVWWYGLKRLR